VLKQMGEAHGFVVLVPVPTKQAADELSAALADDGYEPTVEKLD